MLSSSHFNLLFPTDILIHYTSISSNCICTTVFLAMGIEPSMFQAGNLAANYSSSTSHDLSVDELPLPKTFKWGTATAAYQIEGGASQDGKGSSIWDTFTHLEPSRTTGENGDITCNHYNRVPEDVELMDSLNVDVY